MVGLVLRLQLAHYFFVVVCLPWDVARGMAGEWETWGGKGTWHLVSCVSQPWDPARSAARPFSWRKPANKCCNGQAH